METCCSCCKEAEQPQLLDIHLRTQHAVERLAKKRSWMTAEEIRSRNIPEVSRECMEVLRTMPSWSWEEYKKALARRGYSVKLHYRERLAAQVNTSQSQRPRPVQRPAAGMDYTHYRSGSVSYTLSSHSGREQRFYIPERVLDYFNEEFDYREVVNSSELTDIAVVLFVGISVALYSFTEVVAKARKAIFPGGTRTITTCNTYPLPSIACSTGRSRKDCGHLLCSLSRIPLARHRRTQPVQQSRECPPRTQGHCISRRRWIRQVAGQGPRISGLEHHGL